MQTKIGVILVNIGSPKSTQVKDVRRYLRRFLSDPLVVDLPYLARTILVNLIIAPFRAKQSAHAYQSIWTEQGSPLIVNSLAIQDKLQQLLGEQYLVASAMRYSKPEINDTLQKFTNEGCHKIISIPMFPQYADATNLSAIKAVDQFKLPIEVKHLSEFYALEEFIQANANNLQQHLSKCPEDFILFSYHGLPVRQLTPHCTPCPQEQACPIPNANNSSCYRAQCYQTTRLIVDKLSLPSSQYTTSFQSRLGKIPWIKPYTDHTLDKLVAQGIKSIAVICPSFVADCLETLEEIGMQAEEQWLEAGGTKLTLIPCVNSDQLFVEGLAKIIKIYN